MSVKLRPNADGTIDLLNANMDTLLNFDASGNASFPLADNVYTKGNAETLASLAIASGGIIESGSNANGEFVKLANGWMICTMPTQNITANGATASVQGLTVYTANSYTWNFPEPFVSTPSVIPAGNQAGITLGSMIVFGITTSSCGVTSDSLVSFATGALDLDAIAIGRWK